MEYLNTRQKNQNNLNNIYKNNKIEKEGWYFIPNSEPYGDISQLKSIPQSPAKLFLTRGFIRGLFGYFSKCYKQPNKQQWNNS